MSRKYMFCIILLFIISLSTINAIGAVSPEDINSTDNSSLSEDNSLNLDSLSINTLESPQNFKALKDNRAIGGGAK